jgi:hypothetical protein
VAALQTQKLLPADAHWASVIISAPVQPDDLMAVATSYDHSGRYGAQTPFSDQLTFHWEAGKWEVDTMHNSLVTVGNGGNKAVRAQLTILYNQGRERYQLEQTLAPDEQMWLDFGKLIRERVADKDGRTLPPDISSGTYSVRELTDTYGGNLYEGKVILDKTNGHAAYGCAFCCGMNSVKFTNIPITIPLLGTQAQQVLGNDVCDNNWYDITAAFLDWGTGDSSIATASGKQIHGVAAGATTDFASSDIVPYGHEHEPPDGCPTHPWAPTGGTTVSAFNVAYSSYIPVDHINGPTNCYYNRTSYDKIYMGDANRGTYRTAESIVVVPDLQHYSNFIWANGQSRNYGQGSPASPPNLSAADEDNIPNDCHLWNAAATSTQGSAFDVSYPYSHQAQVHFDGAVTNPLESNAPITWDMRAVIDTTNPQAPTALVNYNHTCYPSHQIKVNGAVVYLYTPPENDLTYIFDCLALELNKVIGQQATPTQVPLY